MLIQAMKGTTIMLNVAEKQCRENTAEEGAEKKKMAFNTPAVDNLSEKTLPARMRSATLPL